MALIAGTRIGAFEITSPLGQGGIPTRIGGAVQSNYRQQYAVSADGQRFLMNTVTQEAGAPITVILNWKARP